MKLADRPEHISLSTFRNHLKRYESLVPAKIQGLEDIRLVVVPAALKQRKKDGEAFLEKAEVISLVEWKLCVSRLSASDTS